MARSAGNMAQLMAKENGMCSAKTSFRRTEKCILALCMATVGQVSNTDHENVKIGKAGRKRHLGFTTNRSRFCYEPMNDHPHGGGEGKCPIGRPGPVTPWGKPALGYKTRAKKHRSDKFIVKRRNGK